MPTEHRTAEECPLDPFLEEDQEATTEMEGISFENEPEIDDRVPSIS